MATIRAGRYRGTELRCPSKDLTSEAAARRPPIQAEHDVSEFRIDRQRTTCSDYHRCERAGVCPKLESLLVGCLDGLAVAPVEWAHAYCKWRNARLPSYYEWQASIRGPQGSRYPDRSDTAPTCVDKKSDANPHPCPPFTTSDGVVYEIDDDFLEWTSDVDCIMSDGPLEIRPVAADTHPAQLDIGLPVKGGDYKFRCAK